VTHRHHVPSDNEQQWLRAAVTAAPLLELPRINDFTAGRLLPVKSVGILDEPHVPYIRLTNRAVYRLPEVLRPWAQSFITVHLHGQEPPVLPCWVEFGVMNGQAVASLKGATGRLPAN